MPFYSILIVMLGLWAYTLNYAYTDKMTKMWRREVATALMKFRRTTVAIVDVDGLKQINDTQGHEAGDATINDVAKQVKEVGRRAHGISARLGGDEFVVVCLGDKTEQLKEICGCISRASVGVGHTLCEADNNMYHNKRKV